MLLKETAMLTVLGITKIPMLAFLTPRVMRVDESGCEVKIPLSYRSKNHMGSMYFGALSCGADLAGGLNAAMAIREKYKGVQLIFKDVKGEFLKRPDGDVHFTSSAGREVLEALDTTTRTGERITVPVNVVVTVPQKYGDEAVARYVVGLSLKMKG
jgi:hypothetical protein